MLVRKNIENRIKTKNPSLSLKKKMQLVGPGNGNATPQEKVKSKFSNPTKIHKIVWKQVLNVVNIQISLAVGSFLVLMAIVGDVLLEK